MVNSDLYKTRTDKKEGIRSVKRMGLGDEIWFHFPTMGNGWSILSSAMSLVNI